MIVTTYAIGFAEGQDDCYIEELINDSVFDWPRVPCIGERVGLWIGDAWIEAKVEDVYSNYRERGNPYIKEEYRGVMDWTLSLSECEIIERYNKKDTI
jgi:hypothetical protein